MAITSNELQTCIMAVLNWLYDKDYLSEDSITSWFGSLDKESRLYQKVQPFIDWLEEAEEASSDEESE